MISADTNEGGISKKAFVTMIADDSYFPGVQALSKSLKATNTQFPLFVLVGPYVSCAVTSRLRPLCNGFVEGQHIEPTDEFRTNASWAKSEFLKLNIWNMTIFDQVVYLDADTLVLECIDELFEIDVPFAAAPDIFPPDKFNAGVLVIKPNSTVFGDMLTKIGSLPSYDGGDTGFLNSYFPNWFQMPSSSRLHFGYNAQRTLYWYTHEKCPGYWDSIQPLKVVHYSSQPKPWEKDLGHKCFGDLEWMWWRMFMG